MAEEVQMQEAGKGLRKRNIGQKKGKGKKKMKVHHGGSGQKVKMDGKMKKLFRKRARDYNSDASDDENDIVEEEEPAPPVKYEKKVKHIENGKEKKPTHIENRKEKKQTHIENEENDEKASDEEMDDDEDEDEDEDGIADEDDNKKVAAGNDNSDDEEGIIEHGIMKFSEGSTSFKKAFKKIVNRSGTDDVLGPVLSAHKNLVVKKLAEEATEKKVKGDAKKEKTLLGEKGHVKPESFDVPHEKLLIGVATKGVVKLFNAVSKAQGSQKGLNPLRSKDAKVIQKRRKEAFFSEMGKGPSASDAKVGSAGDGQGPSWAPLRDNYMLTTSKLKDWDKAADEPEATDDFGRQEESSSDED